MYIFICVRPVQCGMQLFAESSGCTRGHWQDVDCPLLHDHCTQSPHPEYLAGVCVLTHVHVHVICIMHEIFVAHMFILSTPTFLLSIIRFLTLHTHACMHTHAHAHSRTCTHTHTHTHTHAHARTHTHTHTHTHVHTHTHTHTHTHAHAQCTHT